MIEGGSNEILFVYNGARDRDKQALAYVSILSDKISKVDIQKTSLTRSFLTDLAARLGVDVQALADSGANLSPAAGETSNGTPAKPSGRILDLLISQPFLIKTPILVYGDKAQFIGSEADIMQLTFL